MIIVKQTMAVLCTLGFLSSGFGLNLAQAKDKENVTAGQKKQGQTKAAARTKGVTQVNPGRAVNIKNLQNNPTPAEAKAAADAKNKQNCGGPGQFPCKGN